MSEGVKQATAGGEPASPPVRRRKGEKLIPKGEALAGSYIVEDVIGEGGMAIVYAARQKSLNRTVAVKVLHSRFARDPEFVRRFEAEAGALASLNHANVVNIIDRGHDGDRYFFIMEYVQGRTLDQHIIDNTMGIKEWRTVVAACRDALEYVHKRGVVHRDIKPSNILIGPDMTVKIGDFGIAHLVGLSGTQDESGATPQARAMGTANYMAPEQTDDPASVDHRADVYSLGVTFYKMLARALPVGEYAMPSEANHDVPVAVDAVIARAMASEREARYQSVKDFCDALLAALKEQTVSITSVLNYRNSPTPVNALYTGADFRSQPVPSGGAKPGKGGTPAPVGGSKILTPKPLKKGDAREALKTPKPSAEKKDPTKPGLAPAPRTTPKPAAAAPAGGTPVPTAAAPASDRSEKMLKLVAVGATLIVLLLVAAIAIVVSKGSPRKAAAPVDAHVPISEQQQRLRDEIIREKKETIELPPLEGAYEQSLREAQQAKEAEAARAAEAAREAEAARQALEDQASTPTVETETPAAPTPEIP